MDRTGGKRTFLLPVHAGLGRLGAAPGYGILLDPVVPEAWFAALTEP